MSSFDWQNGYNTGYQNGLDQGRADVNHLLAKITELEEEVKRLEEYEWMYQDLCD